jgi:hypothetical protein
VHDGKKYKQVYIVEEKYNEECVSGENIYRLISIGD